MILFFEFIFIVFKMRYLHYIFFAFVCCASSIQAKPEIDPKLWDTFMRIQMARHPEYQTTSESEDRVFDYGEYAELLRTRALLSQLIGDLFSPGGLPLDGTSLFSSCENCVGLRSQLPTHSFLILLVPRPSR